MHLKRSFAGPVLLGLMLTYAGCAPAAREVADCGDLAGTYRASDFGFNSVDGSFNEPFDEGAFEIGFDAGLYDSSFSAPGYEPVGFTDAPYTAGAGTLTFNEPFIDNIEPGARTFTCEVVDEDSFTLRGDVGFDFGDDGVYEDTVFEGTFDRL